MFFCLLLGVVIVEGSIAILLSLGKSIRIVEYLLSWEDLL